MQEWTAVALCAVGAEKVVSNEFKKNGPGVSVLESGFGRVRFKTDLAGLYRALMSLRAADRVLLEAGSFPAPDFDALFEGTRKIPWENFVPRGMGLAVAKVRTNRSQLRAETTVQAMVHKAAAERLCGSYGIQRLPDAPKYGNVSAGSAVKTAELRVYLEKDQAQLLLDISGDPLFKRGYRREGGTAPLRETTAAAILLLSGWKRKFPLIDPFCGSGTIVIEAALYAWDIAPGLGRNFALSDLAFADSRAEERVRRELAEKVDFSRTVRICGSDADEKAAALAKVNLKRALAGKNFPVGGGEVPGVEIKTAVMENLRAPSEEPGFIITNPPYGKRLQDTASAEARYREMASLAKTFPGWKLAVISDHAGFESHFGIKASLCRELKSGAAAAYLYQYEKL